MATWVAHPLSPTLVSVASLAEPSNWAHKTHDIEIEFGRSLTLYMCVGYRASSGVLGLNVGIFRMNASCRSLEEMLQNRSFYSPG